MHHWEDLYQNPPLSKDAALFGLAVLLHLPLFLVKMKAPPDFSQGAAPLVNVAILERIDEQVTLVRPAPALAPERPAVDLNQYRKVLEDIQKSRVKNLPPIPASTMRDIKVDTARKELAVREAQQRALEGRQNFQASQSAPVGQGLAIKSDPSAGAISMAQGPHTAEGSASAIKDRGSFSPGAGRISGIGNAEGSLRTEGMRDAGTIRIAKAAQEEPAVFSAGTAAPRDRGGFEGGGVKLGSGVGSGGGGGIQQETIAPAVAVSQKPKFSITGPLQERAILNQAMPVYPPALRAKGIEAVVQLKFTVTPEGKVKDGVQTLRSSGYLEMDKAAADAIRKWLFEPLPDTQYEDQLGVITMTFSVK